MKLTTDHPMPSYNMPIFVDDNNNPIDYADAIRQLRKSKDWSTKDLADKLGTSHRTVEGWETGRLPGKQSLILIKNILESNNS